MEKAKIITLRLIVFSLVFAGAVVVIIYFMSENPFYVAHDAGAYIKVWLDTNGDGKQDKEEHPLPNVCIWAGYASSYYLFSTWQEICANQYFTTDANGAWSEFFAGGSCNEVYIAANPPKGYRPTTPLLVNDCSAKFGFMPSNSTSEISAPDVRQYLQKISERETMLFRLKTGGVIVLISVLAGFISVKTVRPIMPKAG